MALRQFFSIKVAKSDIVIDAGANIGQFTDYLCKSGATVYSFEPNPFAFEVLKDKFAKTPNVHCLPNAISDDSGMMKLYFHQNSDQDELHYSTGSSLLSVKKNILTDKYINVEVIDICAFISSLNQRIRILKMDIEGEECKVLKKIFETQTLDKIDYIFVETHDHKIPELRAETDWIRHFIKNNKVKVKKLYLHQNSDQDKSHYSTGSSLLSGVVYDQFHPNH